MPLQILTEVTENYIITLLKLLRLNLERDRLRGESGFCVSEESSFLNFSFFLYSSFQVNVPDESHNADFVRYNFLQ